MWELLSSYQIRYTEKKDLQQVRQWLKDPETRRGFPFDEDEVADQFLLGWEQLTRFQASLTVVQEEKIYAVGAIFLMPYRKVAHQSSLYLIVDKEHRRQKIGSLLLNNLIELAKTRFKIELFQLEVFEGFPILPLLGNFGFDIVGKHPEYMRDQGKSFARIYLEKFL